MSLSPKPISIADEMEKSRDVAGFNRWASSSGIIGFLMLLLGWFTIPVKVFIRRDFGQRWFTTLNYYIGLLLLWIIATIQVVIHLIEDFLNYLFHSIVEKFLPFKLEVHDSDFLSKTLINHSMTYVLKAYVVLGILHRLNIWWRNSTGTARHSYYDGTSNVSYIGSVVAEIINDFAMPVIWLYMRLFMSKEQRRKLGLPELINDEAAFTHTIVEPLALFVIASASHGILSIWLYISAVAHFIYANWREVAKQNKMLDFRDAAIEAELMQKLKKELIKNTSQPSPNSHSINIIRTSESISGFVNPYPDLDSIIEGVYRENQSGIASISF